MTLTVRTRAWPGRPGGRGTGRQGRALGARTGARTHMETRGDSTWPAVQCSAWSGRLAASSGHQQFEIHFCPIFSSHSAILLPKHQPATTTTAPFAPSRHADPARADLSQHRRRPVTRFPSPSIAHRPPRPAPTSIANSRFPRLEGPKSKVTRTFPDRPSLASQQSRAARRTAAFAFAQKPAALSGFIPS